MSASSRLTTFLVVTLVVGGTSAAAPVDMFRAGAVGLGYAGFDIEGARNPLSGGLDFSISRNLAGNPLDFGAWDLSLQGPISLNLSTGGRLLPQLDIALTTALDTGVAATPLAYTFNYDVGGQSSHVNGTVLVDAALSLNGFGFYDLGLSYSSRQDVARRGRFANDDRTYDVDVGPINISGNVIADAMALITQPIFDEAGRTNPFVSFSGPGSLAAMLTDRAGTQSKRLAGAGNPVEDDLLFLLATSPASDQFGNRAARLVPSDPPSGLVSRGGDVAVPEPTVLLLMLLGLPFIFRRRLFARPSSLSR